MVIVRGYGEDARKPAIHCGIAGFRLRSDPSSPPEVPWMAVFRARVRQRLAALAARALSAPRRGQAVKELPQPQPPVALGLLKVNPEPCMDET